MKSVLLAVSLCLTLAETRMHVAPGPSPDSATFWSLQQRDLIIFEEPQYMMNAGLMSIMNSQGNMTAYLEEGSESIQPTFDRSEQEIVQDDWEQDSVFETDDEQDGEYETVSDWVAVGEENGSEVAVTETPANELPMETPREAIILEQEDKPVQEPREIKLRPIEGGKPGEQVYLLDDGIHQPVAIVLKSIV